MCNKLTHAKVLFLALFCNKFLALSCTSHLTAFLQFSKNGIILAIKIIRELCDCFKLIFGSGVVYELPKFNKDTQK
jgi:hypothetical protein